MDKTYKVYKHTCPNGKSYIGITGQDERLRWNSGNGYCTQLFGRAVKKYGWKNIKHEILEVCKTLDEAYESEIKYIAQYETTNPLKGYNCDKGGRGSTGHVVGAKTRELISDANKARWADPEYREKMIPHLHDVSNKNIGRHRSKEAIEKTIAKTAKMVDQYSLSGEFIATHFSLMDAARSVGISDNSTIVECCKGKHVTANNFIWRYHGEPLDYENHVKRVNAWKEMIAENARSAAADNCIAIRQEDDDGNLIATYASAVEAQKATGINKNSIRRCCNGYLKHAGHYVWRNA